ncbi:VanZ family protein [Methyloprofundus sp.]|uniref:VanZ family protein n=1 Tax=Methyloprofundus sp. TaxID=2020875 RepID=UPI003D09F800
MISSIVRSPESIRTVYYLWAFVAMLYAFYIWGHIPVSNVCYALSDQYTPGVYRHYVLLAGKVLLVAFISWLIYLLLKAQQRLLKSIAWIMFASMLFFYYVDLVKISIEYVHFVQYCLLTILLCMIYAKKVYLAIVLALVAGLLDEVYQALPKDPMNWRDTLLNVVGVIWGGLLYWTMHRPKNAN